MTRLANRWAGRIYGTNTGNVFLELNQDGDNIAGNLRILDSVFGVSVYSYTGNVGDYITLSCKLASEANGYMHGDVTVKGRLTPQGCISGEWSSTIGTAGTFELYPHDINNTIPVEDIQGRNPEQIHNKTIHVGSVRLFKDDVIQLVNFIKKDFSTGRVIITYMQRECELTKYADDFFCALDGLQRLTYMKIVVQEPEAYGINKLVVIELVESGTSEIRVSGINESWVLGKAESIYQTLKPKQSTIITMYRKHGLNFNFMVFMAMLVAIPELLDWKARALFVAFVLILLNIFAFIHGKFIPNTFIYLGQKEPSIWERIWPSVLSWVIAVSSSVTAAYLFYLLQKGIS
ncbi:MAG: hypothetical protein ACRC91_20380 [Aeromonas sp.]